MLKNEFLLKGEMEPGYTAAACEKCGKKFAYPPGKILMVGDYICEDCYATAQAAADLKNGSDAKRIALGE